jgi:two-component system chemotaxis sensor kinase CheA
VSRELVNLTLGARDRIKVLIESGGGSDEYRTREFVAAFREYLSEESLLPGEKIDALAISASGEEITYRIRFRPPADIFLRGINPLALLRELAELGECRITIRTGAVPPLEELDPELCYLWWDIVLTTPAGVNAIRDVFIFVEDDCELRIQAVEEKTEENAGSRSGRIPPEGSGRVRADQERSIVDTVGSVRVRSEKLDSLVDLIGELVTVQARLTQLAAGRADADLDGVSEVVERLTWELRDQVLNIRMLPIGTTFSRFGRLVRDLGEELGKDVELTTEGAETELDKTVIERLGDPLVHLIRNGIDHGIEAPAAREASGKLRRGRIHLASSHVGASVLLRISDDGAGLDRARILARAVKMGLVAADTELDDKDLLGLIFSSGLSTAASVSSVSGRGVGMDVVKRAVEELRGGIEVASRRGEGTTFTIKLPLTLAIIDGLLVRIGGEIFVIPLSAVEEVIELNRQPAGRNGRNLVHVRGETVPYLRLRERFATDGEPPGIEQVVIAEVDGQRVGFAVDHVIGEHQTVIKAMGRMYRDIKGISGATILGDGGVALILDLPQLVQEAEIADRLQLEAMYRRNF